MVISRMMFVIAMMMIMASLDCPIAMIAMTVVPMGFMTSMATVITMVRMISMVLMVDMVTMVSMIPMVMMVALIPMVMVVTSSRKVTVDEMKNKEDEKRQHSHG